MAAAYLYPILAIVYALCGVACSAPYFFCPRLREEPLFHLATAVGTLFSFSIATLGASLDFGSNAAFHFGAQFFLFLGGSLCYVPAMVYLVLHYSERLVENLTAPELDERDGKDNLTSEQAWVRVQACLESLAMDPANPTTHEQLGDLYNRMGFWDSAVYQYRKAAEWLERGYAQAHLLYKAAYVIVEKRQDTRGAVILLRQIVRLYPKSFFAAYSRRVLNHYEAHSLAAPRSSDSMLGQEGPIG